MSAPLSGIIRATEYEVDWVELRKLLESGIDVKKVTFQPDAHVMNLDDLLYHTGDIQNLDVEKEDIYMKLAATIDPLSWANMVADDGTEEYIVNARLAREAINVGRKAEILELKRDDATCNILDAALFQCAYELFIPPSSDSYPSYWDHREYTCESPNHLCRELVKLGMKPMAIESRLDQRNETWDSFIRALFVRAAFEAGLIQELRQAQGHDQRDLFLTDVPMHIVLAIMHDAELDSAKEGFEELISFGSIVDGMMTYGLSTRFAIENILTSISGDYEVDAMLHDASGHWSRVRESRTSFLKKWRRREIVFSKQRMGLIQKFLAHVGRPLMPASVLHVIDSFLLGEFLPVFDDEVGIDFEF